MNPSTISLKQYTKRKNAPLDVYEMIKREVQRDEAMEPSVTPPLPRYKPVLSKIKPSVGWFIFLKTAINQFKP